MLSLYLFLSALFLIAPLNLTGAYPSFGIVSRPASKNCCVKQISCNDKAYTYEGIAGYGYVPSDAVDKYQDTLGGFGSSIALDRSTWRRNHDGSYDGILWTLPDRGWNTNGTINYNPRIHKFSIHFEPKPHATVANPSSRNLHFNYLDTILFTGPDGHPTTSLDADVTGNITYVGFPELPVATYTGDGFGGEGMGGQRIAIDSEGLVLNEDGSFWVSDEYGPYIYKFSKKGRMQHAIQPPQAYLPRRNGSVSFSANSPPHYDQNKVTAPADTQSGRTNNHGFEGLTVSPDRKYLYALLQSALAQEGGQKKRTRKQARLLEYDISGSTPIFSREFVVTLPRYKPGKSKKTKTGHKEEVASQSEIHCIGANQFLVLSRDSGAGRGQDNTKSVYRHVDIFTLPPLSNATDIKSHSNDGVNSSIAFSKGKLHSNIVATTYCPFLDYNVNSELDKFKLHNGGVSNKHLLNEKWESLATAPVDGKDGADGEFYLFSLSDNDFMTQDGYMNFGNFRYSDESGYDIDSQALVFKIKLPNGDASVS